MLLNEKIFDVEEFDEDDRKDLLLNNAVFRPFHAGFVLKNFRIRTDYDDPATSHAIIDPVNIDTKVVGFTNCDLRIQGTVFRAITQVLNFRMENILLETQFLYRFTLMNLRCAPDGSDLGTQFYWKNITAINSGEKPSYLYIQESFIRTYITSNAHIEDCMFDTYQGYSNTLVPYVFYINQNN